MCQSACGATDIVEKTWGTMPTKYVQGTIVHILAHDDFRVCCRPPRGARAGAPCACGRC